MKTWEIICASLVFIILFSTSLNHMYSIGKSKGYTDGYADGAQTVYNMNKTDPLKMMWRIQ